MAPGGQGWSTTPDRAGETSNRAPSTMSQAAAGRVMRDCPETQYPAPRRLSSPSHFRSAIRLTAIDHNRTYAEAKQGPEPDPLHGSIDGRVECGIDDDGRDITSDEQEQAGPFGVSAAASAPHCAYQHAEP